jgi:D-ribose pyranase
MKKTGVLNAPLARVIASMGHTDSIVIADAGLPVPPGVPCIDLAVSPGVPAMLDVARAVASELEVERLLLADELIARQSDLPDALRALFPNAAVVTAPHEAFKRATANARAIVRTGECSPYANVLLTSGVTF